MSRASRRLSDPGCAARGLADRLDALRTILLVALAGACSRGPGGTDAAPAERPDVLLFVVDTLRADRLGPYGGDPRTSPRLAKLLQEAVLFEDCRAPAPWTLPSMATIFTGLYPPSHGADLEGLERHLREEALPSALADDVATLGTVFAEAGYETWLRGTNHYFTFGLEKGFEDVLIQNQPAGAVVDWALQRLERRDPQRPALLVLHFIDVHVPNKVGTTHGQEDLAVFEDPDLPPLRGRHRDFSYLRKVDPARAERFLANRLRMYDASIRYVDRQLGRIVNALERGSDRPYVVAFTSDHGEDFRDHLELDRRSGHFDPRRDWRDVLGHGHGHNLHGTLTHVPLVIRAPGLGPGRVPERVGLVDVLPTLCELAGVPAPPGVQGRSLVPALRGEELEPLPYVAGSIAYGRDRRAYYSPDGWLYVHAESELERPQLFSLADDFEEHDDLSARRPEKVAELEAALRRFLAPLAVAEGRPPEADEETLESLRALGYLGEDE